jgi:Protein of unknown function (DUF3800)
LRIFVDESGDLGWEFSRPFRSGGSSRYLTLACLILPKDHYKRPRTIIRDFYRTYNWQSEKKASDAKDSQRTLFCERLIKLLSDHPEIRVDVITVKKSNVQPHIRQDANKLYNYMLSLIIPDYVTKEDSFELVTDERSIKVQSANSLKDYLQIKLWFDFNCPTRVVHQPASSSQNYTLQFVDWVAHCAWKNYEDGDSTFCDQIKRVARVRHLFF